MNKTKAISTLLPITLRAWLAVALLAIVSAFEVIKVIHVDHHHSDEIAVCTESDETNACHRSLVHFDSEAGCGHTQHVEKVFSSCEICDALISVHVFEVPASIQSIDYTVEIERFSIPAQNPFTPSLSITHLRGPPSLS